MRYKLTLTEEQYNHIAMCVETCHRIACGDINELKAILPINPDDSLFRQIKHEAFPELDTNEQYGWDGGYRNNECGEGFRESFDTFQASGYQIYRQMRHVQTKAKGICNVLSSPTLKSHKAQQPKIEVIKD